MWYKMKSCMYIHNIVITVIYSYVVGNQTHITKLTFLHKLQVGDEIKITIPILDRRIKMCHNTTVIHNNVCNSVQNYMHSN